MNLIDSYKPMKNSIIDSDDSVFNQKEYQNIMEELSTLSDDIEEDKKQSKIKSNKIKEIERKMSKKSIRKSKSKKEEKIKEKKVVEEKDILKEVDIQNIYPLLNQMNIQLKIN